MRRPGDHPEGRRPGDGAQPPFRVSQSTEVLKDYYKSAGKLRVIDGSQPIEDVFQDILRAIGVEK